MKIYGNKPNPHYYYINEDKHKKYIFKKIILTKYNEKYIEGILQLENLIGIINRFIPYCLI